MHNLEKREDVQIIPAIPIIDTPPREEKIPAICPHTDDFERIIGEISRIEEEIRRKKELPVDPNKQLN